MSEFKIFQRHVRCDRVEEECARQGKVYKKWEPLDSEQDSHASVMDTTDTTIFPISRTFHHGVYSAHAINIQNTRFRLQALFEGSS